MRNKIFNKLDKINLAKNENTKRNKRKSGNLGMDTIDKLTKPFTTRYNEKSNINKTEIANNIIMTEYNDNNHHNQINYLNESSKDNYIMNDINNIPNLYLFDNENIKFPNNPHIKLFMIQNYLKLISFYELSEYNIVLLINLTIKNLFVFREEIAQFKNIKKNKDEIKKEKDVYDKEYYSLKNYKNYDFNIFENIDIKSLKGISLENIYLFINDTISTCFKNI